MKKLGLMILGLLLTTNCWATVGWIKSIPATGESPTAISADVIQNNTAVDSMLSNYRQGAAMTLYSSSQINVSAGGIMVSNTGGSIRLMLANTSTVNVTSANIDTGSVTPSATYYVYAYGASTTATTFGIIFSTSATTPTGVTYFQRIGTFQTDSSSNFFAITNDNNYYPNSGFGTWSNVSSAYTNVLATTDGFVLASISNSGAASLSIFTDNSNPPTTLRIHSTSIYNASESAPSATCPVKKGDRWSVTADWGGTLLVFWIPLGS